MIPLPGTGTDPEEPTVNDEELRALLKRYAYAPPAAEAQQLPCWAEGEGWGLRGAAMACVLFLILGFIAGQNSGSQKIDAALLAALAYATPWQLFVMAPSSLGDNYVLTE